MKIHCCYTPAHEVLYRDHFRPTLPADLEVHAEPLAIAGSGDFLSTEFMACIRRKMALILQSIADHPGEIIIWADVDIEFHRPIAAELAALLASSGKTIFFQRETPLNSEVNTGFFVCRCGLEAAQLFRDVQSALAVHPDWNEQRAVNELRVSERLPAFGYLPQTYYARTHGWPPPRDLRIYHANYTQGPDGVRQKIRQFALARQYLSGGLFAALAASLRTAASKSPAQLLRAVSRRARRPPATT